jgi:NitT/TauT family transport system substrate-binding protein
MKRLTTLLLTLVSLVLIWGCSETRKDEIRIAVNPWIGYSPLYYADAMGWLESEQIRLIASTSLHETVHYFEAKLIDGFASTQYEPTLLEKENLLHIMPLDRSDGGDVILSNRPLEVLLESKKVDAYFEIDSINRLVYNDFVRKHAIERQRLNIINKEQSIIKTMMPAPEGAQLVVTYEPYASMLRKSGFYEVGSTKDMEILVLDSLYVSKEYYRKEPKRFKKLTELIRNAYDVLKCDLKEYYRVVNAYLEYSSYEEFDASLKGIEWLIETDRSVLEGMIRSHGIIPLEER